MEIHRVALRFHCFQIFYLFLHLTEIFSFTENQNIYISVVFKIEEFWTLVCKTLLTILN